MGRVYFYCEGQTEESFIKKVLGPYLSHYGITSIPIICETRHMSNKSHKGGVSSYSKLRNELVRICKHHRNELVTTMFDYYGLPKDTPGMDCDETELYKRIDHIESAIKADLNVDNCIVNLVVHEFEALLFSNPDSFRLLSSDAPSHVSKIRNNYPNPEFINNSQSTAPSKRLEKIIVGYSKVRMGIIVAQNVGMDRMMNDCPHFRKWIEEIKEQSDYGFCDNP